MPRVISLGELTASIAHEVNQPLGAVMFNAGGVSHLARWRPAQHERRRAALERNRAGRHPGGWGASGASAHSQANKTETKMAPLNLNEVLERGVDRSVQPELLQLPGGAAAWSRRARSRSFSPIKFSGCNK